MARWDPPLAIHGVKLCLYAKVFRPVAQFFYSKVLSFHFFDMEKGCGHIDVFKTFPGDTDYKYIYGGLWSNFNCSSMNPTKSSNIYFGS